MTEHLPECPPEVWCICSYLRDCEARVQKIAYQQGLGAGSDEHRQHEAGFVKGYTAALDAAREAVRNECFHDTESEWCVFVAAVDALKEE